MAKLLRTLYNFMILTVSAISYFYEIYYRCSSLNADIRRSIFVCCGI